MSKIIKTITINVYEDTLRDILKDEGRKVDEDNIDILIEMIGENLEDVLLERAEEYTRYLANEYCDIKEEV